MKAFILSRCGFGVCAVAVTLAGCGGPSTTPIPAVSEVTAAKAHALFTYGVLYSFQGAPKDGESPNEALVNVNGTLYGTTSSGGKHGAGTVFAITTSGKETVLYSFKGGSADGAAPSAPLINVNQTLYGATSYAGATGNGVIFAITTSGKETVLYSFKGGSADGSNPSGALLNVNGTLYGTTASGGSSSCGGGCGTFFSITTSGKEVVRYKFKGGRTDGQSPNGGLVNVHGKLYGTTNAGGANCIYRGADCGTVFSVTTSGKETVLHSFKGTPKDGQNPDGGLIYVDGKLYGTTTGGGRSPCDPSQGCGTAFALTLSGSETLLHSFGDGADGVAPQSSLIDVNGMLYGTTPYGGDSGWGTLFEISTSGKERVLHRFNPLGGAGYYPVASLISVDGALYGTATGGGWGYCGSDGSDPGCGLVFALTP